jgi:hypothetical protein
LECCTLRKLCVCYVNEVKKSTASSASPLYRHRHRLLFLILFLLRIISLSKGCLPLGIRIPGLLSYVKGYRHRVGKNHLRRHERQKITWVHQCINIIKQRCTQKKDRKRFIIYPCGPITYIWRREREKQIDKRKKYNMEVREKNKIWIIWRRSQESTWRQSFHYIYMYFS